MTVAQEVSAVTVSPAADTLVVGDTLRLVAEAADANGHAVPEAEFSWASSDTLVAVVDDAGLLTGVGAGEVEVTATAAGVTGRAALAVVAPAPTTVAVTPDTLALTALGQTAQLTAEVRDQAGRVMGGVPVSWSSADTTVAAVDSAGLVTSIGGGATTIAATVDEVSGAALVTVMQSVGSVVVSPAADTVAPGDTLRLVAEAFDENGHRVEGAQFTWSSSDASLARVDAAGLVTGVTEGTAHDHGGGRECLRDIRDHRREPGPGGAGGALRRDRRPELGQQRQLADRCPAGDWYGVEVDGEGRVISLVLAGRWDNDAGEHLRYGLKGLLPTELADLANLKELHLQFNGLTGPIPSELGGLAKLERLDLGGNNLSGPIPPELGGLAKLERLGLGGNNLTGPIPPELGGLAKLERLGLGGNNLTGPIPPELGDLANLTWLNLRLNDLLSGPIPSELGDLAKLTQLYLGWNNLTGPIPPEIGNLTGLRVLNLAFNDLTGTIPESLLKLEGLNLK